VLIIAFAKGIKDADMSDKELILSEVDPELIPTALSVNDYYVLNDQFVQDEIAAKKEIAKYALTLEPWEVLLAKRVSEGANLDKVAKEVGKRRVDVAARAKHPSVERLVHQYLALRAHQDGPNELLRRNMLWRIAVKNETTDPKESIKAIAELNRMAQARKAPTGFKIVINGVSLEPGALDE